MHLNEYKKIAIRNSCDRYGFAYMLALQQNLPVVPRSFADWNHGWIWNDDIIPDQIIDVPNCRKNLSIVVGNSNEGNCLQAEGYTNVVIGGLPFAYVPHQNKRPISGALAAFLPHSSEAQKFDVILVDYLDYLASCVTDFSEIYVIVYWLDNSDFLQDEIKRRKLKCVLGAKPDDRDSLIRIRNILEYCPYVTSNTMGSHIAYALYVGCRVSICGNYYEYDYEKYATIHNRLFLNKMNEVQSRFFLVNKYPWLFVDHPLQGVSDIRFGRKVVGLDSVLSNDQIKKALGWTLLGQMSGYSAGIIRKLGRTIV